MIYPFREDNGRAQRLFIEYLAYSLGYDLDLNLITKEEMLEASVRAFAREYGLMNEIISRALFCYK